MNKIKQVICINCSVNSKLKVGEIYTVNQHIDNFYLFYDYFGTGVNLFHESQFIPLSDADETDLLIKRKMNKQ